MSVILQPFSSFPIVRQISNHLDGTTYHVRARIYNASGDIIDTVNLESKGAQRYQSRYRVPADTSGQGAYISIITSVYTDSGYTTKSSNYGDEENTYLVFDRILGSRGGGGGGNLDIGTLRRVVAEELEKAKPEPIEENEKPEIEEIDTISPKIESIQSTIDTLLNEVKTIPKNNTVNLTPLMQGMSSLYEAIQAKEVTPETDLTPIMEAIDSAVKDILQQVGETRQFIAGTEKQLSDIIIKTVEENMKSAKFVNEFKIEPTTATKPAPQPAQPVYDISKLTS